MCRAGIRGLATRTSASVDEMYGEAAQPKAKAEILAQWDEVTTLIDDLWPRIPARRFEEVDKAFGVFEGRMLGLFLYLRDRQRDSSSRPGVTSTCARWG